MARGGRRRPARLVPRPGGRRRPRGRPPRRREPGGRLPTTWGSLADAPVTQVVPDDGELPYDEGVFIGYRAWEAGARPAYPFGHGLGYTDWTYETVVEDLDPAGTTGETAAASGTMTVRVRTRRPAGRRSSSSIWPRARRRRGPPRPLAGGLRGRGGGPETRRRRSSGFRAALPRSGTRRPTRGAGDGSYEVEAGRSIADRRLDGARGGGLDE